MVKCERLFRAFAVHLHLPITRRQDKINFCEKEKQQKEIYILLHEDKDDTCFFVFFVFPFFLNNVALAKD